MRGAAVAVYVVAGALAGCGDNVEPAPTVLQLGPIRVTIEPVPPRIEVVRLADGEVIFDGVPEGIAFRAAEARIETQVGAFKIEDDVAAPTTVVRSFQQVVADDDSVTVVLGGAGGASIGAATISITEVSGADINAGHDVTIAISGHGGLGTTRTSLTYRCEDDEHFLGLGGQSFDVDHRGQVVPLWVEEDGITKRDDDSYDGVWFLSGRRHSTHTPMPMMLSSRGFAAAVDTDARAVFSLCAEAGAGADVVELETWERELVLHLFVGFAQLDDPATELRRSLDLMTAWVGRPAPPPAFVFAPWHDAIYGEAEVRRVADKLRAEGVASSVIWTEDWRGGNDEGTGYVLEEDWRVDRDLYPNFETLADDLHAAGYKFLTYHNTFIDQEADVFDEALDLGYSIHRDSGEPYLFTGVKFRDATLLDLSSPAAVAWAKAVYDEGLVLGADGWMADFAEWLPHDAALASGADPMLAHNRYPVEWARLNHDLFAAREAIDGVERVFFVRSAWLGSQPLVSVVWAGDQQTDFSAGDGLPSVIPIGLGLGVTGFPYYGHDIGGYMSQLTVPTSKELWFRWCTLGALSPVMRTHHGRSARDNWNWESDDETVAHAARWARVHIQLADYLAAAAERGLPIMRPVALSYPDLPWAWTTTDQYLLGDRILVAPVVVEGATTRSVALPPGRWYPLLGGQAVTGGDSITVGAAITEIPAFVAEGAVLVLLPDDVDTLVDFADQTAAERRRIVQLYPGTANRPEVGQAHGGAIAWSGRDAALPAPTTATLDGVAVPVVQTAAYVSVQVTGCGTLSFAGGGDVTLGPCDPARSFDVRLHR